MLEPAATIVRKLGGVRRVAEIIDRHPMSVYRWGATKKRGGFDGMVPIKYQPTLIAAARAGGIALIPDDFFPEHLRAPAASPCAPEPPSSPSEEGWLAEEPAPGDERGGAA